MAKLKVPSLQHLARMWRPDPVDVKRHLIGLAENGPTFSYEPVFKLTKQMLVFQDPYEQIVDCVIRAEKREQVRANYLGLLSLIRDHFVGVSPAFVQNVAPRFYPVSRDLIIRFSPPLIYGHNGEVFFPWFSFWKSNPLAGERLSLFVTVVEEILLQDSDLEDADFQILDFSVPKGASERVLEVKSASSVPRLDQSRKAEMLSVFAEGFRLALSEPLKMRTRKAGDAGESDDDDGQLLLDI